MKSLKVGNVKLTRIGTSSVMQVDILSHAIGGSVISARVNAFEIARAVAKLYKKGSKEES